MVNVKAERPPLRAGETTSGVIVRLVHTDPDKALVMICIGQLVADGYAQWTMLGDGDIELSLSTGETFLKADRVVVRLA